ncbi:hypothetical protein ABIF63_001026 [Bradyrhizobium japonicum]|uniref:Uncharacterized protein n=1 Tax=Bradyrhizobium japonicum TaxID=375 RepID=A0ABV2RKT6_BRAJP
MKPIVHGKFFGSVNLEARGRCEQLRHLLGVEIFLDGRVHRRADDLEGQQHLVALDELADLLHGLRRRIGVVILDQIDLATIDAALVVDHLEIGGLGLADRRIGRRRSRERHGLSDLDLGVAGARIIFFLGTGRGDRQRQGQRRCRDQMQHSIPHSQFPQLVIADDLPGCSCAQDVTAEGNCG